MALTHASAEILEPQIVLEGDRGSLRIDFGKREASIERDGDRLTVPLPENPHAAVPAAFAAYVRTGAGKGHATLEMSRAHAAVISGASQAAPVVSVPSIATGMVPPAAAEAKELQWGVAGGGGTGGGTLRYAKGLERLLHATAERHVLFHESGLAPWTVAGRALDLRDYHEFKGPAHR